MDDAPGRDYFLEFVARHGSMSRTRFLDKHKRPVLLITSEAYAGQTDSKSTDALHGSGVHRAPASLPFFLYPIEKREGANTTPAVTVGRSPTNDIVIPDPGISRIHAA